MMNKGKAEAEDASNQDKAREQLEMRAKIAVAEVDCSVLCFQFNSKGWVSICNREAATTYWQG